MKSDEAHDEFSLPEISGPLGIKFADITIDLLGSSIQSNLPVKKGVVIHFVNTYTLYLASRDTVYKEIFQSECINVVDGKPLSWLLSLVEGRKVNRVRGPSLFFQSMETNLFGQVSHYLIGGTDQTRDGIMSKLSKNKESRQIAGFECPPFRPLLEEEKKIRLENIAKSRSEVVWLGLGTPKQDFEARDIAESLNVLVLTVGAAFDFYGGLKREAPKVFQHFGLEWLFRLFTEPGRLWKRYLFGNLTFLKIAIGFYRDAKIAKNNTH